jgi:hypothetical protein
VLRVLMEIMLIGWVFTGKRWDKNKPEENQSPDA